MIIIPDNHEGPVNVGHGTSRVLTPRKALTPKRRITSAPACSVSRGPDHSSVSAVPHLHALLALAAATAVGTASPDGHAWADVAATRLSARKPKPLTVRLGPWSLRPSGLPSPRQPGLLWHARALSAETTGLGRPHQPRLHATGRSQVNWVSPRSVDTSP